MSGPFHQTGGGKDARRILLPDVGEEAPAKPFRRTEAPHGERETFRVVHEDVETRLGRMQPLALVATLSWHSVLFASSRARASALDQLDRWFLSSHTLKHQ